MASITLQESVDNITTKLVKEDNTNTDTLIIVTDNETGGTINSGDEIELLDSLGTRIFLGLVQNIKTSGSIEIEVYDYGAQLLQRTVNQIYTGLKAEEIIESIIDDFTDMTYVSTITSTTAISTYKANKKKAWDIVTEMSELLLANFRVDKNKNFQLEQEGENNSSEGIIIGGETPNSVIEEEWIEDTSQLVNSCTVDGDDRQFFDTDELGSGTGSQTVFTLSEIPIDIRVEHPVGTLLTGYVDGQSTGDYQVDRDNKQIIFDTAPSNGTDNIFFQYNYSIPVSVRRRDFSSITDYGQHDKVYKKTYIKSREEARDYANFIISRFSQPLISTTVIITDNTMITNFENLVPNEVISVVDNTYGYSGDYIIKKVDRSTPGQLKVEIGEPDDDILSWSKESQTRIKQLEEKDDNSSILNEDEYIEETLQIDVQTEVITFQKQDGSDAFVINESQINGADVINGQEDEVWVTISPSKFPLSLPFSLN